MAAAPLAGIRVLDLGVVLAGPYGTLLLADLGAEVIRVESTQHFVPMTRGAMARPPRELVARWPPISGGYPDRDPGERPWNRFPWFNQTARNKLGMTVDLRRAEGRDLLIRLAADSDALVTNRSPGALDALGVGYDVLAEANPRLVYVDGTSFGATGPYRGYRALGLQMEAFAGHDLLRHYPDREVDSNTWAVTADAAGALGIALAVQLGLYARRRTGKGQYVDLSMVENFVGLIGPIVLDHTVNGRVQPSLGNRDYAAVQGCYPCAGDDRWLVLTIRHDDDWAALRRALADPDWARDERLATAEGRYAAHDELDARLAAWTRELEREAAVELLRREGIPAGPVLDDADAYADPHLAARDYFVEIEQADSGTHRYPGWPYRFARAELSVRRPPVRLGEHNELVYKQLLGVSDEEYERLRADGHVGTEYAPHIR
jgi:crotonobetainyl-CoA:carnitine CoA-transferase CaiB-like acyl-CoA transferase